LAGKQSHGLFSCDDREDFQAAIDVLIASDTMSCLRETIEGLEHSTYEDSSAPHEAPYQPPEAPKALQQGDVLDLKGLTWSDWPSSDIEFEQAWSLLENALADYKEMLDRIFASSPGPFLPVDRSADDSWWLR
jgi:hypothetical protein